MTDEEPMTKLYQRMSAEQERYRNWLLSQSPADILNHAAEYTIREDIMVEMEELELTAAQTQAMLKSESPLADVYRLWSKTETHHMDDVRDVIGACADAMVQAEREQSQQRVEDCHILEQIRDVAAIPNVTRREDS